MGELVGLTTPEAEQRLAEHGPNALPETPPTPLWRKFLRQFRSPLVGLLLFALAFELGTWVYGGLGAIPVEALAIAAILLLNAGLGTLQERRSEQALAQLRALAAPLAWVLRDGKLRQVESRLLVPGDLLRIEAGERVPADGEIVEALGLSVDESVLTGESVPVEKELAGEASSGTLVVRGKGQVRVTRTGPKSAMGRIATMLAGVEVEATPLERRLAKLGHQIARVIGGLTVVLATGGLMIEGFGRFEEVVIFAIALAVAAVPEGMPAVVTLTLALGVQRMVRKNAVVRRLAAVEALGSVTVIATDKTGTLTENKMVVRGLESEDRPEALRAMALANDADLDSAAGDPLELGLLAFARAEGLDLRRVRKEHHRSSSKPFDSAWKYMRVTVERDGVVTSYLKGAPEVILARSKLSDDALAEWRAAAEALANEGLRVLALASAEGEGEEGLSFLGLVTLWDPPRPEVAGAIGEAQRAGVRVLMVTGDHPGTARAVARTIGLVDSGTLTGAEIDRMSSNELREAVGRVNLFARVSPEHKLRLVEALKARGEIVAMTGDGVNDAPALKRADVGVAMGRRGSDVAREVADLVLVDDNFASIVGAIEEGRGIYENIQAFIRFTFSTNVALVLVVIVGAVGSYVQGLRDEAGLLLVPLTALQLLWINFLGDGPPALALALDRNPGVMDRPPRSPKSDLLDRHSVRWILGTGLFQGTLGILLLAVLPLLGASLAVVRTAIFLYESIAKLLSAYPARRLYQHPSRNPVLHAAIGLGLGLQALALFVPGLRGVLGLAEVEPWLLGLIGAAIGLTWLGGAAVIRLARIRDYTSPDAPEPPGRR